jgi:hypothetical protein
MDIVADNELVIEIKAAERLLPIHEAQNAHIPAA